MSRLLFLCEETPVSFRQVMRSFRPVLRDHPNLFDVFLKLSAGKSRVAPQQNSQISQPSLSHDDDARMVRCSARWCG
jgi:hypothetical protein